MNCGSLFVDTGWSGEEGCDTQFAVRFMIIAVLWLVSLVLGSIGLVVLYRVVRYT